MAIFSKKKLLFHFAKKKHSGVPFLKKKITLKNENKLVNKNNNLILIVQKIKDYRCTIEEK